MSMENNNFKRIRALMKAFAKIVNKEMIDGHKDAHELAEDIINNPQNYKDCYIEARYFCQLVFELNCRIDPMNKDVPKYDTFSLREAIDIAEDSAKDKDE